MRLKTTDNDVVFDINSHITTPSARFKGGGGGGGAPPMAKIQTKLGKELEQEGFTAATRAMEGGGFLPSNVRNRNLRENISAFESAHAQQLQELPEQLNRFVRSGDTKVREGITNQLNQGFLTSMEDLRQADIDQLATDEQLGTALTTDLLAGARKSGVGILNQFNQAQAQRFATEQQFGTFASNLGQGIGSAAGFISAADQYANLMAT